MTRAILVFAILAGTIGCDRPQPEQQTTKHNVEIKEIREPAVAGLFYPNDKKELAENVDRLLADAAPKPVENLRALVCPHAGYRFSGHTAAVGYKLLRGMDIDTVVVMAPSHYASFDGASIPKVDAYQTPLGLIAVSPEASKLAKLKPFVVNPPCEVRRPSWWRQAPKELPAFGEDTPHSWEHSLEVQLPFLQQTLKNFRLAPIIFGRVDPKAVADALDEVIDGKTLLVASSDLSHYHPYETAKRLDDRCIKAICSLDPERVERQEACGKGPILTLIHLARKNGWRAKLLDYRNSGDTSGDKSGGVVGYAAIAFYEPAVDNGNEFTEEQRKFLLKLARKTVTASVRHEPLPVVDRQDVDSALAQRRACFVTLTIDGRLRGCIGSIFPEEPLYRAVIRKAQAAAMADPRFPPVTPKELKRIEIEISVLTLPEELEFDSPEELLEKLRPGVDGVVLRLGNRQATYLPQVWEKIPEKRSFLSHLAKKAGLGPSEWMNDRVEILVYQVEAF